MTATTTAAAMPAAATQRLLTPGPTAVPPQVLDALALPIIHHRTKQFRTIFKELSKQLQWLFETSGPVLSMAGSGTTAFEAAQVCLVKPGSSVITVAGGKFGERWQDVYEAYAHAMGINIIRINHAWGTPAPLDQIEYTLREHPQASVVTVVHSETSTATVSDVQAIARLTQNTEALLLVDGITSVGAMPVRMDDWGIDCLVTGSQKALMLPPGLGYVGLGPRAMRRLDAINGRLPAYNLDLRKWVKAWKDDDVPFTPPVSLLRGQKVALDMIQQVGREETFNRTSRLAQGTRAAFAAMNLKLISQSPSDSVTGAFYPKGVDDAKFRGALRDNHGIHIAGGQDGRGAKWKSSIFRISHMGYVNAQDTTAALAAIAAELTAAGHRVDADRALEAFAAAP